jgi:CheY-like chemotaxis protein
MSDWLPPVFATLLVVLLASFLIVRLRFFTTKEMGGRYPFLIGAILAFLAAGWGLLEALSGYPTWFVDQAYPVIEFVRAGVLGLGLILITIGLAFYADFWQTRREDIESRESKLSILENLQHDARQPYQLMDLLTIALREIIYHLPDACGAIFLLNRPRRQFVLASASGLTKQETALLEYYPFERNMVSQAIDLGDPVISSSFEFIDRDGKRTDSRFRSCLVLPLVSGMEKVGGLLLFSDEEKQFGRTEIRYLAPVSEWLAEKIRTTRLSRQVSLSKSEVDRMKSDSETLMNRIASASTAFSSLSPVEEFCRSLVGLLGSESAHLIGLSQGSFHVYGGSEALSDLPENYKTALVDAVDRDKALIINQESTVEGGRSRVVLSSLVVPLGGDNRDAILLRRPSSAFSVGEQELKMVDIFAHLAHIVLKESNAQRLNIARRKGFEVVLQLLKSDRDELGFDNDPGLLMRRLAEALPPATVAATFTPGDEGALAATVGLRVEKSSLDDISIPPGQGYLGRAMGSGECSFIYGRQRVSAAFDEYEQHNRDGLKQMSAERGMPVFLAHCPITGIDETLGVVLFQVYEMDESQRGEWERLLTLATRLYSLRIVMSRLQEHTLIGTQPGLEISGAVLNQLNNHLSAVIGKAELGARRQEISGEVRRHLKDIIAEAEAAAAFVRKALGGSEFEEDEPLTAEKCSINRAIERVLADNHISGDLYMAGGRPREIRSTLSARDETQLSLDDLVRLFSNVVDRFGATSGEDDVLSVVTYREGDALYLDVSRHRRNFPPVEHVAGFGRYYSAAEAFRERPSDVFLRHVSDESVYYSVDRESDSPAYLSFRFPLRTAAATPSVRDYSEHRVRVLAIDDHAVILDLIAAMGRSLGYQVDAVLRGEEGVRLARTHNYDVILTDLALPDISGLEVARRIREHSPAVPIILVTGWEASLDHGQLESAGIHQVLYKPFRIEQLTEIVQSSVSGRV